MNNIFIQKYLSLTKNISEKSGSGSHFFFNVQLNKKERK